jgi:integrase
MASVFRKHIVRYLDAAGRQVPKGTLGARKVKEKSGKWYGRLPGEPRPVALCRNRKAAELMLAEKIRKAELAAVGVTDPFEAHNARPLAEHVEDYRRHLLAKGDCSEHVSKTDARIRAVLDGTRAVFVGDLSASAVAEFLGDLRRDPPRPELPRGKEWLTKAELLAALGDCRPAALARVVRREGLAARGTGKARRYHASAAELLQDLCCRGMGIATSNGYTLAIKGFAKWLVRDRRMAADPLVSLSCLNAKLDVRHGRRALPEDELRTLLTAARDSTVAVEGLTGVDRGWLYAVAMAAGFRASELASLAPESFRLGADPPLVIVRAAYTKNRQQAEQPLPPDLAAALGPYLDGKPAGLPVWPGTWPDRAAEMLRQDLAPAGIPYRDGEGRVCDFHSLRHSFVSLLARSGIHPKMAQTLARHSTITLTMDVYSHLSLHDAGAAVASLPSLLPSAPDVEAPAVGLTGTDGAPAPVQLLASCSPVAQTGDIRGDRLTTHDNATMGGAGKGAGRKSPSLKTVAAGCERLRLSDTELPGQDSNLDKESQNLLCYRYTTG